MEGVLKKNTNELKTEVKQPRC